MDGNHGVLAEDTVESLCCQIFGQDFVLRSPTLIEESGPKELADILIIVDDIAFVIQSKSIALDISELEPNKFKRIEKRHDEAKHQLNTTLNAHRRGTCVQAMTSLGVNFEIDWSVIKKKVGIITLHVSDAQYKDPEFRFQYPSSVERYKDIVVHTFLLNDLELMRYELNTPADFLSYLEVREKTIDSVGRIMSGNELDFLALTKIDYPKIEKALVDPKVLLVIQPGFWEDYRRDSRQHIKERSEHLRNSILIDRLIREMLPSVEYSAAKYSLSHQESSLQYLRVIGKLGKLTRAERAMIGDMLVAKAEKTKKSKFGYFMMCSTISNITFLFLIINEADREKRIDWLKHLCIQACHKSPSQELVGIATSGPQQKLFSTDILLMDVAEIKTTTKQDLENQFFGETRIESADEWALARKVRSGENSSK